LAHALLLLCATHHDYQNKFLASLTHELPSNNLSIRARFILFSG
jgi:hypothetical protein